MVKRDVLIAYLHDFLEVKKIKDGCPNGLQVEGREDISRIVTSVSASVELFEKAAAMKADAIMVHHGMLWNKLDPVVRGGQRKRLKVLLENNMNLLGYHLPLDCHQTIGNNVLGAKGLGLREITPFGEYRSQIIGFKGRFTKKVPARAFFSRVRALYGSIPQILPYGPDAISTVGVISGGAQEDVYEAVKAGLDAYVTGEISEFVVQVCKEAGLHYAAAGHYATERLGIRALGEHVQRKFKVRVDYVDVPVPV